MLEKQRMMAEGEYAADDDRLNVTVTIQCKSFVSSVFHWRPQIALGINIFTDFSRDTVGYTDNMRRGMILHRNKFSKFVGY